MELELIVKHILLQVYTGVKLEKWDHATCMQVLPELKFLQLLRALSTAVSEWIKLVQAALWLQTLDYHVYILHQQRLKGNTPN